MELREVIKSELGESAPPLTTDKTWVAQFKCGHVRSLKNLSVLKCQNRLQQEISSKNSKELL